MPMYSCVTPSAALHARSKNFEYLNMWSSAWVDEMAGERARVCRWQRLTHINAAEY